MTARVIVREDITIDGVAIAVRVQGGPGGAQVLDFRNVERVHVEPVHESPAAPLRLNHDAARALYEALAQHYGGIHNDTGVQALRADYDHERDRVDKLIDHVIRTGEPS